MASPRYRPGICLVDVASAYKERGAAPACLLLVVALVVLPALTGAPSEADRGRAPSDTLGGFKTDEVALESAAVSMCPTGTGARLAYYGTINTAPSVALMAYGASGGVREQVAAKYPFAVAVAPEPGAGGKVAVSYITNTASGLEVNLAVNKTGNWASTAIGLAKPAGKLNCTGVAVEPGGVAHVIFLNATHLGHHSNSTLSYLPADQVAPSIAVSPAGTAGIALSSGGVLQYAMPWANSTGFDSETVSTTVQPESGSRLSLIYDPAGRPAILFTSSGSAQLATFNSSWTVSTVAPGAVLAAALGGDGMYHLLVEKASGTYSSVLYISGDSAGAWQTIDLGQCRPGYPAGITVTPQGVVHIAINTALKGFLHGYRGAVPGPVQSLDATAGNKKAIITWQPPSGAEAPLGFRVKRGTSPSALSPVNDSPAGTTAYIDAGLSNGVKYYYSVFPYNEYGESRTSPVINVTPNLSYAKAPGAPYALGAIVNTSGGIDLIWKAPSDDGGDRITSYKIYRGTSFGSIAYYAQTAGAGTFHNDRMYAPGTTYYYRVSAVNEVGEGEGSNIADCTSKAVVYTLVTNVTPEKFVLGVDGTGTFNIEVTVTGNGEPMAGVTVIVDVEDRPGYTRYGLTDSKGTVKFNAYTLNRDAEGKTLTVRSSLEKLNGSRSFPIAKKTVTQEVTDRMPLIYMIIAGAVVLSCTAGAGALERRRAHNRNNEFLAQKEHEIRNVEKLLANRLSKPVSSGGDLSPVGGDTLFASWKEALAAVAKLGGAASTANIDESKLLSTSVEYCGDISAQEEREIVKESIWTAGLSVKMTITPKPQPAQPKEGAYADSKEVFYRSETVRNCHECGGATKVACPKCHARRRVTCPTCGGSKLNNCAECGGSGMAGCPTCASGDRPNCPGCKGRGYTTTKRMRTTHGGGGWVSDGGRHTSTGMTTTWSQHSGYSGFEYVDDNRTCDECGGTGKGPCPECGSTGKGKVPCGHCGSSGKVTCGRCDGSGEVHCVACDTNGQVPCSTCGAMGKMKDFDKIEYTYMHYKLAEDLPPSFGRFGKDDLDRAPEAVTEISEAVLDGRRPGEGEDTKLLDKLIERAKEMHSDWKGKNEGRLLFRTGWKVRALPVTCGEVLSEQERPSRRVTKESLEHKIFAAGASKRWFLRSDGGPAIAAEQQHREKDEKDARHSRYSDSVRRAVWAALAVEGVVWALLLLRAAGIVRL